MESVQGQILYSVVVPVYNDGYLAPRYCDVVHRTFSSFLNTAQIATSVEVIFINDGSADDSIGTLCAMARQHDFVRVIDLSRNFGQHIAIACGLREARGSIVIRMNIDMQDHPEEIPRLIGEMSAGDIDLVIGQYEQRESPWLNRMTALVYYRIFKVLTGFPAPQNTSALRAMSRRFVEAYNLLTERSRFPQGLDQWLGFNQKLIPIKHHPRVDGRSSYNFWSRLSLGVEGVLYFSDIPLKFIAIFGFILSLIGISLGIIVILTRLFFVPFLPGFASLASIGLLAFGFQLGCMGVVGLYVARIFREAQNRPLYIIKARY